MGMFQEPIGCKIEDDDPFGKYVMHIHESDHIKKVEVKFMMIFDVVRKEK